MSSMMRYLQVGQRHLGFAELAAGLSVFTFPAQVVGNLFPHHPLFTFTQRTGNLEERTHIQVVLQTDKQADRQVRGRQRDQVVLIS